MRKWEVYDQGAQRLAERIAPGDEDVLQEARLGMLEGMLFIHREWKDLDHTREEEDAKVREFIESHIYSAINADSHPKEVNSLTSDERRDRDGNLIALRNAVSPIDPPDVIYERKLRDERIRHHVRELPSPEKEIVMFRIWEPERLEPWLEEKHPELITDVKPGHDNHYGVFQSACDTLREIFRREELVCPLSIAS